MFNIFYVFPFSVTLCRGTYASISDFQLGCLCAIVREPPCIPKPNPENNRVFCWGEDRRLNSALETLEMYFLFLLNRLKFCIFCESSLPPLTIFPPSPAAIYLAFLCHSCLLVYSGRKQKEKRETSFFSLVFFYFFLYFHLVNNPPLKRAPPNTTELKDQFQIFF